MHKLLEEVMKIARLFVAEFIGDHADLWGRRHAKKSPCVCDAAFHRELMHRLPELFLERALDRLDLNGKFSDNGMKSELNVAVMLQDEMVHRACRMLQEHLVELIFWPRSPSADFSNRFAFTNRQSFGGGFRHETFLYTTAGQGENKNFHTEWPTASEPGCRLSGHSVFKIILVPLSLGSAGADGRTAANSRTLRQRFRLGATQPRDFFSRRGRRRAEHRKQEPLLGIGGAAATGNKCSSHCHSPFFSLSSKLHVILTERRRARARVKQFRLTIKGDYESMRGVNKSRAYVAYTKHLHLRRFNACMTPKHITTQIGTLEAIGRRKTRSEKSNAVIGDLSPATGNHMTGRAQVRESEG